MAGDEDGERGGGQNVYGLTKQFRLCYMQWEPLKNSEYDSYRFVYTDITVRGIYLRMGKVLQ